MFNGTVDFKAAIRGNGLSFSQAAYKPNELGVDRIVLVGPTGSEIRSTVYLKDVPTEIVGTAVAEKANTDVLNRLSFIYAVAIDNAVRGDASFTETNPQPGVIHASCGSYALVGQEVQFHRTIIPANIEVELSAALADERYLGLFRSALQAVSTTERFMHLYHVLLMLCGDRQHAVEQFIQQQDPGVPTSADPRKPGKMETVYTRLRNELAHPERKVELAKIKADMGNWVGTLAQLTQQAIKRPPPTATP